jgi:hypothetical protein
VRLTRLVITILLCSLNISLSSEVQRHVNPCEGHLDILASLGTPGHPKKPIRVSFGGRVLVLSSERDAEILTSLRREVRDTDSPNTVIYAFFDTSTGIATLRLETRPGQKSKETLVKRTSISADAFHEHLAAATQPNSNGIRKQLRDELGVADNPLDSGKLVLLFDPSFYGLTPRSIESDNALVFGSPSIKQAVEHAKALERTHLFPAEITAFVGYPEDESEYSAVFGKDAGASTISEWKNHMAEMRKLAEKHNFSVYGIREMNGFGSKQELLDKIVNSKAIVWIVAHSDGCFVKLSTGEKITVDPSDISALKLVNSPLVIIRVCDAADSGFAEAFLKAGASAVWVNKGISNAARVNRELSSFLDTLPTTDLGSAIKLTEKESQDYFRGSTLYVERTDSTGARNESE